MFLTDSEAAPLLIPGDDVVLFLPGGRLGLEPQAFTGVYWSTTHGLKAVPGNPFGRGLDGLTAPAFQTLISSLVR